jgi:V8-like Glu-specific endopeptidase
MTQRTVFLSYSHDSAAHRDLVLGLSERLRADGISTILDRYVNGSPPEGWPRWMLHGLQAATHVLCVCTASYHRRFLGQEEPGQGKGVDWEGAMITQALYDARSRSSRFIPVLTAAADEAHVPLPLRGQTHYVIDSDAGYQALYDALLGQSGVEPGPVGTLKLKPRASAQPLAFGSAPVATSQRVSPALAIWQEKLDFLLVEEAVCIDPSMKFRIRHLITEAKTKIQDLGGSQPSRSIVPIETVIQTSAMPTSLASILEHIARGDLSGAIAGLRALQPVTPELANRILLQSGILARLKKDTSDGLITRENSDVAQNRIATALVGLVRELQTDDGPLLSAPSPNATVLIALRQLEASSRPGDPEALNGVNNLKSIAWIERGLSAARSVCRILVSGPGGPSYGTGFLVAPGLIMTNHHVIGSKEKARAAKIEFNYQLSPELSSEPSVRYELDPDTTFRTDPAHALDYTLVAVRPDASLPPLANWGHLQLNATANPLPHESVAIIQHPNGQVKQIALQGSRVAQTLGHLLHYTTDTLPGSSGSPVFNDLWQVIALHHAAGPDVNGVATNEGILISAIRAQLGDAWATLIES